MKLIRVGVDLAKNVFQVHGVDRNEKPVWRRRLTRNNWLDGGARAAVGARLSDRHGSVQRGAPLGAQAAGARLHGQVDRAAVREAVREEQQERRERCRGDLRGDEPAQDALRCVKTVEQQDYRPFTAFERPDRAAHGQRQSDPRAGLRVRAGGPARAHAAAPSDTAVAGGCAQRLECALPAAAQACRATFRSSMSGWPNSIARLRSLRKASQRPAATAASRVGPMSPARWWPLVGDGGSLQRPADGSGAGAHT